MPFTWDQTIPGLQETFKEKTIALYIQENRRLDGSGGVREYMRVNHNFDKSVSSYRREFSKWGIKKNDYPATLNRSFQKSLHSSHGTSFNGTSGASAASCNNSPSFQQESTQYDFPTIMSRFSQQSLDSSYGISSNGTSGANPACWDNSPPFRPGSAQYDYSAALNEFSQQSLDSGYRTSSNGISAANATCRNDTSPYRRGSAQSVGGWSLQSQCSSESHLSELAPQPCQGHNSIPEHGPANSQSLDQGNVNDNPLDPCYFKAPYALENDTDFNPLDFLNDRFALDQSTLFDWDNFWPQF